MRPDLLEQAITCDGEHDLSVAVASLPTADRAWYELLSAHAGTLAVAGGDEPATGTVVAGHDARTSRPRITPAAKAPPGGAGLLGLRVPADICARHRRRHAALAARQRDGVAHARAWLDTRAPAEIRARLSQLTDYFTHTGPFIVFVDEQVYSNVYDPPNLTGGAVLPGSPRCALTGLPDRPPLDWSDHEVRLFYSLTHVAAIGEPGLLTEMNFRQLGYWEVREHLADGIGRWTGRRPCVADATATDELVRRFTEARRAQLAHPRRQVYRVVRGRAFTRVEHTVERSADPPSAAHRGRIKAAPPPVRGHAAVSVLRETLARICATTGSDYAMSRGVRDFAELTRLLAAGDYRTAIDWEPDHYFCLVVARRRVADGEAILRSISERMKYNSWHFLPDSLRACGADVPASRDYFFAPDQPDLAVHEDRVHAGHIRAAVKFTIRVPKPVTVLGQPLRGLADLRLVRADEPRYTVEDLRDTLPLADEIAEIHQTMADLGLALPPGTPEFERYDDAP